MIECRIDHDLPGSVPRELCRHCFPSRNQTPYKTALDKIVAPVVNEKLKRKQERRERNRIRKTA
jgi:hypothetical protein